MLAEDSNLDRQPSATKNPFLETMQAAQAGDEQSLGFLMNQCRDYLMLIANQDLDADLQAKFGASDFVQQTMLAAHEHIRQFRGQTIEEFKGWLRQILKNDLVRVRRQFRSAGCRDIDREHRLDDSQLSVPQLPDSLDTPGTDAVLREHARILNDAMEQLPENYRLAVRLRDWEDRTFPEIGQIMGISEEAARKLWRRAISRLEALVQPIIGNTSVVDEPNQRQENDDKNA